MFRLRIEIFYSIGNCVWREFRPTSQRGQFEMTHKRIVAPLS